MARLDVATKAMHYFELYYALGSERSFERLRERCREFGIKVPSSSSIAVWSKKWEWQAEVARRIEREKEIAAERAAADVERMNERQAWLGAALQNIAAEALAEFRGTDGKLTRALEANEIATFVRIGRDTERLARGAATDREEIVVGVWTTVIHEIASLFVRINPIDDPERRTAEFADGVDEIAQKYVATIASRKA